MNKKMLLLGVLTAFLTVETFAKAKTVSASLDDMPLKQLLLFFADSQQADANLSAYLHIKGIRWERREIKEQSDIKDKSDLSNTGYVKLKILGESEADVYGGDGEIRTIGLSSHKPSRQFKRILEVNLGEGSVVKEVVACSDPFIKTKKAYTVNFVGKPTIYVSAYANFSFEPYMSPLYTYFRFELTHPDDWEC